MIRLTPPQLKSYFAKVKHLPVNHVRPRFLAPRRPHRASPFANKVRPEAIKNTEDQHRGIEWYNRTRNRKEYRHWPFIKMSDDPIRHHKNPEDLPSRSFSVNDEQCQAGRPLWNYYNETSRDYKTATTCPASFMSDFISVFTAKVWNKDTIVEYLKKAEAAGYPDIASIADPHRRFLSWNKKTNTMPHYLAIHATMCAKDISLYNMRRAYRQKMQTQAVLRTVEMERYFALPYLHTKENVEVPAQPQPLGVFPEGEYLYSRAAKKYVHAIQGGRYTSD